MYYSSLLPVLHSHHCLRLLSSDRRFLLQGFEYTQKVPRWCCRNPPWRFLPVPYLYPSLTEQVTPVSLFVESQAPWVLHFHPSATFRVQAAFRFSVTETVSEADVSWCPQLLMATLPWHCCNSDLLPQICNSAYLLNPVSLDLHHQVFHILHKDNEFLFVPVWYHAWSSSEKSCPESFQIWNPH